MEVQFEYRQARKALQRILDVEVDGFIGEKTLSALRAFIQKNGEDALIIAYVKACQEQLVYRDDADTITRKLDVHGAAVVEGEIPSPVVPGDTAIATR